MPHDEMLLHTFINEHSGELVLLTMVCLILVTLLIALPQLLRANMRKHEMTHLERIKAIEKGLPLPLEDDRSRLAGRTAMLVPMVLMISAATVTSFLVVYKSEWVFPVSLTVWIVAGIVSMAALTGGVALIARLAQIQSGDKEEEEEDPHEASYMK
jgi:hypothetical protein